MNITTVCDGFIELEPATLREKVQLAKMCDVNLEGVCKVSVIFIRGALTDEITDERFQSLRRAVAERDAQDELPW